MVRGNDTTEGLWDTYLKPELIGKDEHVREHEDPVNPENGTVATKARAAVMKAYEKADIRSVNTKNLPKVVIRFRDQGTTWDIDYDSSTDTLNVGSKRKVQPGPGPTPPEPEKPNVQAEAISALNQDSRFASATNIQVVASNTAVVTLQYVNASKKFNVKYNISTKRFGAPTRVNN